MGESGRVGVAVDFSACSRKAVKWAIEKLTKKGDHLILITVRPNANYESGEMQLWEATGSPLIPLSDFSNSVIMKKYGVCPDRETLEIVTNESKQKEITVLLKIYWGDPRDKLCESVDNVPLDCLVIGNRGLGPLQRISLESRGQCPSCIQCGVIMGSVSNYVVNNATVPVTVVKS